MARSISHETSEKETNKDTNEFTNKKLNKETKELLKIASTEKFHDHFETSHIKQLEQFKDLEISNKKKSIQNKEKLSNSIDSKESKESKNIKETKVSENSNEFIELIDSNHHNFINSREDFNHYLKDTFKKFNSEKMSFTNESSHSNQFNLVSWNSNEVQSVTTQCEPVSPSKISTNLQTKHLIIGNQNKIDTLIITKETLSDIEPKSPVIFDPEFQSKFPMDKEFSDLGHDSSAHHDYKSNQFIDSKSNKESNLESKKLQEQPNKLESNLNNKNDYKYNYNLPNPSDKDEKQFINIELNDPIISSGDNIQSEVIAESKKVNETVIKVKKKKKKNTAKNKEKVVPQIENIEIKSNNTNASTSYAINSNMNSINDNIKHSNQQKDIADNPKIEIHSPKSKKNQINNDKKSKNQVDRAKKETLKGKDTTTQTNQKTHTDTIKDNKIENHSKSIKDKHLNNKTSKSNQIKHELDKKFVGKALKNEKSDQNQIQSKEKQEDANKKKINTNSVYSTAVIASKIVSNFTGDQNVNIYSKYGQHPALNFNILDHLLHLSEGKKYPYNDQFNSSITVQVISSSLYYNFSQVKYDSYFEPKSKNDGKKSIKSSDEELGSNLLNINHESRKGVVPVPGETGFVLCISDGFSSMLAFIQTRENESSIKEKLYTIPTLSIIRLIRPTVRIIHGSKMIFCDSSKTIHMPVPVIGNPSFINIVDKIKFVQPLFNNLGSSIGDDNIPIHRQVIKRGTWEIPNDFFVRENININRLSKIDFITLNHPNISSSDYVFNIRDEELQSLFEKKLTGFELEYWLLKQYLNSVVLFWKMNGKFYIYQFENRIVDKNIQIPGDPVFVGGLPMIEQTDTIFSNFSNYLKPQLKFVILYTDHRHFENSKNKVPKVQNTKWTIEEAKTIPLVAFFNLLPPNIIEHICLPLKKIFQSAIDNKMRLIQNLLDFTFFYGKQIFLIHLLKYFFSLDEVMHTLYPFIEDRNKLNEGKNIFGILRQFLLLNRIETERFFSILPSENISQLLSIFYLDQIVPDTTTKNQALSLLMDEIDMLGIQSHLRRLNPQLLQTIAEKTGIKYRSMYDENVVNSILASSFPFIYTSLEFSKSTKDNNLFPTQGNVDTPEESFHLSSVYKLEESDEQIEIDESKELEEEDDHIEFKYNIQISKNEIDKKIVGIVVELQNDEGYIYCLNSDGETNHYISFYKSKPEDIHIGTLVKFHLSIENNIRADNVEILQNLTLSEDIVRTSSNIKKMMIAYKIYLQSYTLKPNCKLDELSPLSIIHSHSPYFIQERNPAQLVGVLLRDKFSVLDRPLSISSSTTNEYYGVVVDVSWNSCDIIESTTYEKVIFYYEPNSKPHIGLTFQFQIVHIGFIAYAMNVKEVSSNYFKLNTIDELIKFNYFLNNEIERIEKKKSLQKSNLQKKTQKELSQINTSNSEKSLLELNLLSKDNLINETMNNNLIENSIIEIESEKLYNENNQHKVLKYTVEEMQKIHKKIQESGQEEYQIYKQFCENGVSNIWLDGIDYEDSSSDDDIFDL